MIEKIKNEIKSAFEKIERNREIPLNKIRVKININPENNKLNYEIFEEKTLHSKTDLAELIGSIYAMLAEGKLKETIKNVTTPEKPNAMLFLKNGELVAFLCNDNWQGHPLKPEDLFE